VKPTKEMVIRWISDSLAQLEFAENAFLDVVMRKPDELKEKYPISEDKQKDTDDNNDEEEEDNYELIQENDYDFELL
jgi:hypothetical protein